MSNIANTCVTGELPDQIVTAIASVVKTKSVLHEPKFVGNEWKYLKNCLDSTFVSSVGEYVDRFEAELADYTGAKFAIATVNGTSALHVALLLAGVDEGQEVLVPALTFAATANAVAYCKATPPFVDSCRTTLGVDADKLRQHLASISEMRNGVCVNRNTKRVIKAMVPMHTFGHPSDLYELQEIAEQFNLTMVEDAAESLGSMYHGKHTGTFGKLGILSFNGNKTITSGGGGAILTNDSQLAKSAKALTTTAKVPHTWDYVHSEVAYNYRMPNINAALGCAQLEVLPSMLASKRELNNTYAAAFKNIAGVSLIVEPENCVSNYWLQAIALDLANISKRDQVLAATNDAGYMTRPVWSLLHNLDHFAQCPRADLSCAEILEHSLINIPSSAFIASSDIKNES